jgi:hypothetical protein
VKKKRKRRRRRRHVCLRQRNMQRGKKEEKQWEMIYRKLSK